MALKGPDGASEKRIYALDGDDDDDDESTWKPLKYRRPFSCSSRSSVFGVVYNLKYSIVQYNTVSVLVLYCTVLYCTAKQAAVTSVYHKDTWYARA